MTPQTNAVNRFVCGLICHKNAPKLNLFVCTPHNDLLSDRLPDEAYCLALPGERYAVFFPDSGEISLDVSATNKNLEVEWYDIINNRWRWPNKTKNNGKISLATPGEGPWVVLILVEL